MDSVQVSGEEEISNKVIASLGLSSGKCPQLPDSIAIKSCSSSNPNLPLAENLGNLSFNDESNLINSSIKNSKHIVNGFGSNGFVKGLNNVPDGKLKINLNHEMDNSLVDKPSSQYQTCSYDSNDASVADNSSENINNLKELETSDYQDEPSKTQQCLNDCSVERQSEVSNETSEIRYVLYESELQMPDIMRLIQKDLSEPYSIYTYRYFIHNWPNLCFLAMHEAECVGAIVCKLDMHRKVVKRGYIAMLAVDEKYRKRKIGSNLVLKAIKAMVADKADEVVLETEITNQSALRLYENLGFVRDKRLFRYYLNGVDALRLKLWLR